MPSPPIQVFLTTIASQPALRQRQELLLRTLQVKRIPFTSYDLASDEDAKRLWKRKAPADQQQLPGILVGGKFPGPYSAFEEAIEYDELPIFLRLTEDYNPDPEFEHPILAAKPIGVPGASPLPSPGKPKLAALAATPPSSPLRGADGKPAGSATPGTPMAMNVPPPTPVNRRNEFDVGDELSGFGLQGVKVTGDELARLVEELGLEGDEAEELVKGLKPDVEEPVATTNAPPPTPAEPRKETKAAVEEPAKEPKAAVEELTKAPEAKAEEAVKEPEPKAEPPAKEPEAEEDETAKTPTVETAGEKDSKV